MILRINRYISKTGYCSRREAEKIVLKGRVTVNGNKILSLSFKVDSDKDIVKIDGKKIAIENKKYYIFYKPKYVVSTMKDPQNRDTIANYFKNLDERLYPVGRLDYESEGMIFVTNDGDFANKMLHPSFEKNKTYIVKTDRELSNKEINIFKNGVVIDDKITSKAKIYREDSFKKGVWYKVIIHEGRNRQIRKMFAYFNTKVYTLKRIAIGNIDIGKLLPGKFRPLKKEEITVLMRGK